MELGQADIAARMLGQSRARGAARSFQWPDFAQYVRMRDLLSAGAYGIEACVLLGEVACQYSSYGQQTGRGVSV